MLNTLSSTNKNIAQISTNLLQITKKITEGKGTVGLLLSDTIMSNDLKITMMNLRKASAETSKSIENLNKLITSLNNKNNVIGVLNDTVTANKIKAIFTNLENSSNEIDKVVTNLNATILNIKNGKGAINYLSNDPNLVKKIDSTMTANFDYLTIFNTCRNGKPDVFSVNR
jgi:phospholipid/cholesterol/gamma-HCH transport system substrate-binding protein